MEEVVYFETRSDNLRFYFGGSSRFGDFHFSNAIQKPPPEN